MAYQRTFGETSSQELLDVIKNYVACQAVQVDHNLHIEAPPISMMIPRYFLQLFGSTNDIRMHLNFEVHHKRTVR